MAAGFFSFVPTDFQGVAELGLISGAGMLIAFVCTVTVLPALVILCRPPIDAAEVGCAWAAPVDVVARRFRWPLLSLFGGLAALGIVLLPRLAFDGNPLHTKDPTTEAMRALEIYEIRRSPILSPQIS